MMPDAEFLEADRRRPTTAGFAMVKPSRGWLLALLALCILAFALRWHHIKESLPYPSMNDELHIAPAAAQILKTGDYHPGRLRYPALPTYIAAGAMAIGFLQSAADSKIRNVAEIASVTFPRYSHPRIMRAARMTFALFSVLAIAAAGWMAWLLVGRPSALLTASAVLLMSDYFFMMSWRYLNVDIIATAFVTAAILAALYATRLKYSLLRFAVAPAACAGLAAASKYTHVVLLAPIAIAIALFAPPRRRLSAVVVAALTAGLVFVAANPFSVLDLPTFLNDLAYEVRHYASGHLGHDPETGWPKLGFYARAVSADLGIPALIAAGVGLGAATWSDWRRAAIIASFVFGLLGLLMQQRVEFARNILPLFPLFAVFVAAGIHFAHDRLCAFAAPRLARRWPKLAPWSGGRFNMPLGAAIFLLLGALVLFMPMSKLGDQLVPVQNSRNEAVSWIKRNLPNDTTLIVPSEMGIDVERLIGWGFPVRIVDFVLLDTAEAVDAAVAGISPVAVLIPRWYADPRFPGAELAHRLNAAARQASLKPILSLGRGGIKVNSRPILINHLAPRVTICVPER